MPFFVYIMLCSDGTFYTGYTKNVEERAKLHLNGKGAKYTKSHPPTKVSYIETFTSRSEAMRRERAIKKLSHQQKQELVDSQKERTKLVKIQKRRKD
jgi:putative endonuclease